MFSLVADEGPRDGPRSDTKAWKAWPCERSRSPEACGAQNKYG